MTANIKPHIDITIGVDFERSRERLSAEAGRCFRLYRSLKADASVSPEEVAKARENYLDAQARSKVALAAD